MEFAQRMDRNRIPEERRPRAEGSGRDAATGLLVSLGLHLMVAIAVLGVANPLKTDLPPPTIDLALVPPVQTEAAVIRPGSSVPPPAPPSTIAIGIRRKPPATPPGKTAPGTAPGIPAMAAVPVADDIAAEAGPVPHAKSAPPPSGLPAGSVPSAEGIDRPAGTASGPPAGKLPAGVENAPLPPAMKRAAYSDRSYGFILDIIRREAAYPLLARRLGWEGRVVVAFRILPDGSVRDIRVVEGSGHAVLDRNAVEAVRSASPFPRPPAAAEIITPVVYTLK